MVNKAATLKGYKLDSLDGEFGEVKEFYFDDRHWTIRYLVANTGGWLTGRQVLISPYALVAAIKAAHQKLSDQLSDQAGRFPRGGGATNISGDLSAGESLHSEAEQSRRLIGQLAGRINALLAADDVTRCSIAISGAIHKQLLEAIDPKARAKIGQVLASNLAKTAPSELPAHFDRQLV